MNVILAHQILPREELGELVPDLDRLGDRALVMAVPPPETGGDRGEERDDEGPAVRGSSSGSGTHPNQSAASKAVAPPKLASEGFTAMILPFIVRQQCLSAQPWSEGLVHLAGFLPYNRLHEIAVQER